MQHQTADGLDLTQEVEVWSIAVPGLDSPQQIKGCVCVLLSPAGSILEINSKQYNLQSWLKMKKDPTGTRQ
jgi:hypothetical protein